MFCEKCGMDLGDSPNGKFCPQCGEEIYKVESEREDKGSKESHVLQKKGRVSVKKKIAICFGVILIVAFGVVWEHDTRIYRTLKAMDDVVFLDRPYSVEATYPEKQLMVVRYNNHYGLFNYAWEEIMPCKYAGLRVEPEIERICAYTTGEEMDIVLDDKYKVPIIKENGSDVVTETMAVADADESDVYISSFIFDLRGNRIKTLEEIEIAPYHDERAVITRTGSNGEGLKGAIDKDGNEIIPCKNTRVDDFVNGVTVVKTVDGDIKLLDKEGNTKFEAAASPWSIIGRCHSEKYITIGTDWEYCGIALIDEFISGNTIIPPEYQYGSLRWTGNTFEVVKPGKGAGVFSTNGEEIIPCVYQSVESIAEGESYVCSKRDSDTDIYTYTVFSKNGETKGEYRGTELDVNEQFAVIKNRIPNTNADDIIVINSKGDVLFQQDAIPFRIQSNGLYIIGTKGDYTVGNVLSPNSTITLDYDTVSLGNDFVIASNYGEKHLSKVIRYQYGSWKEWMSLDGYIRAESFSGLIKSLNISNNTRWLPFLLSKEEYYIGVVD